MPAVSIVMACYNGMPYLPDAIDSLRNQTFSDWELIVVNDGSTDDSRECLSSFAAVDSRIRILDQPNQGQQVAADYGIRSAQAELIARMDADDVCEPRRLEKQVQFMQRHPEVGLVGSQICRLGSRRAGLRSSLPTEHYAIRRMLLRNHHAMCNPTVMFRKPLYEFVGGYWEHNISEDWDLFLRIGEVAELANLPDVLLQYRVHASSINGRRIVQAQLYNEYAAHLASLREAGRAEISFDEFQSRHAVNRWPQAWLFYADALSIGQYRQAVAEVYGGRRFRGTARLLLSMLMSPPRTLRRCLRMFRGSQVDELGPSPRQSKPVRSVPVTGPVSSSPFEHRDGIRTEYVETA